MFCSKCGKEIPAGSDICVECMPVSEVNTVEGRTVENVASDDNGKTKKSGIKKIVAIVVAVVVICIAAFALLGSKADPVVGSWESFSVYTESSDV